MWPLVVAVLIALSVGGASVVFLDGPAPSDAIGERQKPNRDPQPKQQNSESEQRGSERLPLVVKLLPAAKDKQETAQAEADRQDVSSANWWMVRLTGVLGFIGLLQLVVFGIQASRLKKTIEKMDEIAAGQTADMKASISEATRAATAMERVSIAAENNTQIVAAMAASQREFWQRQMRAYISVRYAAVAPQDNATGWRTEVRLLLVNTGLTPAHNVTYQSHADVLPHPLPDDFDFPIPDVPATSASVVGSQQSFIMGAPVPRLYSDDEIATYTENRGTRVYMYGTISYEDSFGVRQHTNFSQSVMWFRDGSTMGVNTLRHNAAT